jgi:hypothetical protein
MRCSKKSEYLIFLSRIERNFETTRKILSKEKLSRMESTRVSITDYFRYVNFNADFFRIQRHFLNMLELYEIIVL